MSMQNALEQVVSLPGVQAAFVFDSFLRILSRRVPNEYNDEVLQRIGQQVLQMAGLSWQAGVRTQEFRLVYERTALYARLLGQDSYLIVFMTADLEPQEFRQPINLAALVLEKSIRPDLERTQTANLSMLGQMAVQADRSMKKAIEQDESFAGQLRRLCYSLMGQSGRELVDNGLEEEVLAPPLVSEEEMQRLIQYVLKRAPHPILRRVIEQDAEDLLRVALKEK